MGADRLLVCGGRDFSDHSYLYETLDALHAQHAIKILIHGGARGADSLASRWAIDRKVTTQGFPADWTRHGLAAGHMRNAKMIAEGLPDLVVAFPGGKGTRNMVKQSRRAQIRVIEL